MARLLTTEDNPWNPFTNWDEWFTWDHAHGYDTCNYLARIAKVSPSMSQSEYDEEIERAMTEILYFNLTGNYKIVTPEDYK